MAYETVVAVFDTAAHAEAAIKALKAGGFADADISLFDDARLKAGKAASSSLPVSWTVKWPTRSPSSIFIARSTCTTAR